jgi:medium-chain acyl-[acyl-carrier-protein] hydrolase
MDPRCLLTTQIAYADVDRHERLLLVRLFQRLQEAAIRHARQAPSDPAATDPARTSWMLHRMALGIPKYATFGDTVTVETWSSGIRGFRGYREYRVWRGDDLLVSASSLWLYVDLRRRAPTRVPAALIAAFPVVDAPRFQPDLDQLPVPARLPLTSAATPVTVRYADIDSNGHVNNSAYADYLQTALIQQEYSPHPGMLHLRFGQEIRPDCASVIVRSQPVDGKIHFEVTGDDILAVQGEVHADPFPSHLTAASSGIRPLPMQGKP